MQGGVKFSSRNIHRPLHIYGRCFYFLTARTLYGKNHFALERNKEMFVKVLKESVERFNIKIYSWVLLDNHYHMIMSLPTDFTIAQSVRSNEEFAESVNDERLFKMSGANFESIGDKTDFAIAQCIRPRKIENSKYLLVEFVRKLHKDTARNLNKAGSMPGRKIWYQYWDYSLRNIPDFWKHFNYIVQNPLKHGLVKKLSEAYYYKYSSNPAWLEGFGKDGMWESFTKYSVRDWTPNY